MLVNIHFVCVWRAKTRYSDLLFLFLNFSTVFRRTERDELHEFQNLYVNETVSSEAITYVFSHNFESEKFLQVLTLSALKIYLKDNNV